MIELEVGNLFEVQFVWQLPDGGFLRAIFSAEIEEIQPHEARYLIRLKTFVAGRQEDERGEACSAEAIDHTAWQTVIGLIGRKVKVAYESADGRPLYMRYATLTGEHNFFSRFPTPEKSEETTAA